MGVTQCRIFAHEMWGSGREGNEGESNMMEVEKREMHLLAKAKATGRRRKSSGSDWIDVAALAAATVSRMNCERYAPDLGLHVQSKTKTHFLETCPLQAQ